MYQARPWISPSTPPVEMDASSASLPTQSLHAHEKSPARIAAFTTWSRAAGMSLLRRAGGRNWRAASPASNRKAVAYTFEIPSIGLMSPTNRRRSAMVNSPGVLDGSSGFQFLPLSHRYEP
jgi:hypothetical protein